MYMAGADLIEGLLADLQTLTEVSRAGVISRREVRLEPGEIRPAAVLFLDMVGFTPLTHRIGAEQVALLVDRTFRIFELTIRAHGGYQTGFGGDSASYIFAGHPNYAPICEAALRAAFKLRERSRQINESLSETGVTVNFRIGVSFGEVTVKAVGREEAQLTVMGDAINTAQRLESIAKPGTVVTTKAVLEKAGDIFQAVYLGPRQLKGVGEVATFEVTHIVEQPVALRGAFRQLTPLVGRVELKAQVSDHIKDWLKIRHDPHSFDMAVADAPLAKHNKLMILGGVSAIGKSRLAFEVVQELRAEQRLASTTVHCTERASLRGYTAELARIAGLTPDNLIERWAQLCAASAAAVSPEYAERQHRHLPLLAHVLDCRKLDTSDIAAMDVSSFETSCMLACRACCELAAHYDGSAVLLVIEDLQWLGDQRDAIQDLLCHACLPQPLIALATARPQYQHEDGTLGEGESCEVQLAPLTAADGDLLLDALLPGLKLPNQLLAELHDKANGIPYYYEEFARMLERRRLVAVQNGSYSLVSELDELDVPEDVRALVLGRLDQLEPRLKELAMRASVLGRSFSLDLLAALETEMGFSAPDHPSAELELLAMQHVLVKEPGERFFFEHVLLREAAYGALLHHNRRILHHAAARVLESLFVPGSVDEFQLMSNRIMHLFQAEQYDRAQVCCGKLLLAQARSGRYENWDRWEQLAAECQAKADGGQETTARPCFTMLRARGVKLLRQGEYKGSREYIEQSLQAAREAGDDAGLAGALCDLGILSRQSGRAEEALDYYQQALQIAERIGDFQMEAVILGNIGKIHYFQGYVNLAIAHYEQGLAISREHGDRRSEALMQVYLGALHLDHGNSELAKELYSKVLELARQTGNRVSESLALSNLGIAAHNFGHNDEARELWQQAVTIDREIGFKEGEAFNLFNLGELACEAEEFEAALSWFEQSLKLFREQSNFVQTIMALAGTGKVLAMLGRLEEAAASLTEASAMCELREGRAEAGIADCCWVYYYLANNDMPKAQVRLAQARNTAQAVNAGSRSQLTLEIAHAERLLEAAASHEPDLSAPQSY